MSQADLRNKVLLDLVTHPLTLWPALIGGTIIFGAWVLSMSVKTAIVLGGLGIVVAVGNTLTRLIYGGDKVAQSALRRVHEELQEKKERNLDELDKKLVKDRDPRTQRLLRDLRSLSDRYRSGTVENLNAAVSFDVENNVQALFEQSVLMLGKSYDLNKLATTVSISAGTAIRDQREKIIKDVERSVEQLGKVLAEIEVMDIDDDSQQDALRQDLEASVDIARKVREELSAWDTTEFDELKSRETASWES